MSKCLICKQPTLYMGLNVTMNIFSALDSVSYLLMPSSWTDEEEVSHPPSLPVVSQSGLAGWATGWGEAQVTTASAIPGPHSISISTSFLYLTSWLVYIAVTRVYNLNMSQSCFVWRSHGCVSQYQPKPSGQMGEGGWGSYGQMGSCPTSNEFWPSALWLHKGKQ